jgi:hypothetical protein
VPLCSRGIGLKDGKRASGGPGGDRARSYEISFRSSSIDISASVRIDFNNLG